MALLSAFSVTGAANPVVSLSAAGGSGDTVAFNPGKTQLLLVNNGSASNITVTITAQRTTLQVGRDVFSRANISQNVAAGTQRAFLLSEAYVDASGIINISYSATTTVTVALLEA